MREKECINLISKKQIEDIIKKIRQKRMNYIKIDKENIKNVFVNQAAEGRRRTYRAHGSINAYCSSNCHVEILCEELKERVKKEKKRRRKKKKSKVDGK